ncbi:MAG: OmpA family protein [Crocinitomix sp.]|nr:OmpA family protein [Crocinitomix sp.]
MKRNQIPTVNSSSNFLTIIFLFLSLGLWAQNKANVHFEVDVASLATQEQTKLKQLFKFDLNNAISIQLIGHTDADGSDTYNSKLSKKRVEFVRNQLIELGCSKDKITVDYKGEKNPLNANKNDTDKEQNRRVEIVWQKPEAIAASSIQDLYNLLEQQKQTFCINPNRDTILTLDQGTVIVVPAGSFKTQSKDCILLKTKEVYKLSDMLLENLSTTSDGRLLETAGMVYTEATDQDGNSIYLKKGTELTIMIPTDTLRADMQLFTGARNATTNHMDWAPARNGSSFWMFNFGFPYDWCDSSNYEEPPPPCVKCGLFCRIGRLGRTMRGATNYAIKMENREFRKCQKSLKSKEPDYFRQEPYPYQCIELMEYYKVSTYKELNDTLMRVRQEMMKQQLDEFEKYGVTNYRDYQDTLMKLEAERQRLGFENIENKLADGTGSAADLKYYTARINTMGWINCDAFSSFPMSEKITMLTDVPFNTDFDCKLVFRDRRSIMAPGSYNKVFGYAKIPPDYSVWLMALKYVQGQAYISLHETTTREKAPASEFRAVSIKELQEELKKLDS